MSIVSKQGGGYWDSVVHTFPAFFEVFNNDHLVGKIHPLGCEVEGFGDPAPSVIKDATKGAHGPIVSHGGAEERIALSWSQVEASTKRIIEISCVMHNGTRDKDSITIARQARAEAAEQTMTAPRRRAGQRWYFAPVWGESVAPRVRSLEKCRETIATS